LIVLLRVLLALVGLVGSPTTTGDAAIYVYDAPVIARVDVPAVGAVGVRPAQLRESQERSASPAPDVRGTSTTPNARSVATEAGEQLQLFDTSEYVAGGVERAAEHGGNW
jgi:hypothetical protein